MEDSFTLKDFLRKFGLFKEVTIYKRLKNLYKYCVMFDFENNDRLKKKIIGNGDYALEFKSNLGTVQVIIQKDVFCYGEFILEYSNYAGSTVFTIDTLDTEILRVEPMLGEDLTAKDIDMALYELELYLQTTYGDVDDEWARHTNYKQYQYNLHKEEVNKLK